MPELGLPIRRRGALLKVLLRPSAADLEMACLTNTPPLPVGPLLAYLDTGASDTMLDLAVVESLGLQPVRSAALNVLGREEVRFHDVYDVEVALASAGEAAYWVPLTVLAGAVYPTGAVAALGRDFLAHFVLTYDGPHRRATLRW